MMTRVEFEEQLESLRTNLLRMGSEANEMLGHAMESLASQDGQAAQAVIAEDDNIDALDLAIESDCMKLLALQNPMARDLRLVGASMKIIIDLERIGDHAVDIAKVARKLSKEYLPKPLVDLPKMGAAVRVMLRQALEAFVKHDLALVEEVIRADDQVDEMFHSIRDDLLTLVKTAPEHTYRATYLLFVAHYLERIADHTVNIAERVHYVETGELSHLIKSPDSDE